MIIVYQSIPLHYILYNVAYSIMRTISQFEKKKKKKNHVVINREPVARRSNMLVGGEKGSEDSNSSTMEVRGS